MTAVLLIVHSLLAVTLLGALTHQASSLWWPARATAGDATFVTKFRAVKAANYVNAIIVLFILTFVVGAYIYPSYRIGARIYMEDLKMSPFVGSFEFKEHIVSIGVGLLPAYWYFWRKPLAPRYEGARKALTLFLALIVWYNFLVGHILNNIHGI